MKFLEKLGTITPLGKKKREAVRNIKRLWQQNTLIKSEKQSDGRLYDYFLSCKENDIHKWHHYFDIYERHLNRFVGRPLRFLEIGVFRGGSLRMWRDYFGPTATIVGIDIDEECAELDGINGAVRIGNQSDERFLASVCEEFGPFDVVLDDGGHLPSQQIASFCHLYPKMRENGLYICEDTQTNFWPGWQDIGKQRTFVSLACDVAKSLIEPHSQARNKVRFSLPMAERDGNLNVSLVAASTFSVQFYDSIIVFEKRRKGEPRHEIR